MFSDAFRPLIKYRRVNLMNLVEEAVEGCWIGHHARMSSLINSEIGSVYAPPSQSATDSNHVETVVDIDYRATVNAFHVLVNDSQY
jgi:hypothetical protein